MNNQYTAVVDYSKIKYFGELHTILRDALDWPKWYGCNPDALDDILVEEQLPKKIIFFGTEQIYKHKGWGEYFEKMLRLFDEMVPEYANDSREFSYEIRN